MSEQMIATITASASRRVVAVALIAALGGLLIALGLVHAQNSIPRQILLLGLGVVFLLLADRLRRATQRQLVLTPAGLHDSAGRLLATIDQIASIERGTFAFRPSNGFLLRLKSPAPRGWAPGLWWRVGRNIGVGGMISKTEGRYMADAISALLPPKR